MGAAGLALPGALLYTYTAGTLTPLATYTNQGGGSSNANPVVCDAAGQAAVWLGTSSYRMILKTAAGVTVWDVDNVSTFATLIDFANTSDVAKGDALLGVKSPATGAVGRTQHWKNAETVTLWDFAGGDPTAISDWTTALTLAVAYMNAAGIPVLVPPPPSGQTSYVLSHSTALIINKGGLIGTHPYGCVFSRTDTTGRFLQLGDDALAVNACIGVQIRNIGFLCTNGTAAAGTPALDIKNLYNSTIDNCDFQMVGKAIWINGTKRSTDIRISHITRISQSLVNEDLIRIGNASAIIFDDVKGYVNAANNWPPPATPIQTAGAAIAIRPISGAQIDTIKVLESCEFLYFYAGYVCEVINGGGSYAVNLWIDGTFDSMVATNVDFSVAVGGTVTNVDFGDNFWATSWNGYGVRFSPSGLCDTINFSGGHITQTGVDGMLLAGSVTNVNVAGMSIDSVDRTNTGSASAIVTNGSAESITVSGCRLGGTNASFAGYTSEYGITMLSDTLRYNFNGNNFLGTVKGVRTFAHAAGSVDRRISNNVGDSANIGVITVALPASTVAYTNKTGYIQDIYITGGTVTVVAKNGTTIYTTAGNYLISLAPGETFAVTYTVAPTVTAFQR